MVLLGGAALAQAPAANYDEAKVPAYTLPPLLVMNDGTAVSGAAGWEARRAEIRTLLESQMFGRAPGRPDDLTFAVDDLDKAALGGTAVRKQVSIRTRGLTFRLLLYLPARATGPVPVFVGLGFAPNQSVSADPGITLAGALGPEQGDESDRTAAGAGIIARLGRVALAGRRPCSPAGSGWRRCTTATSSRTWPAR